jgi:hypothetical protein
MKSSNQYLEEEAEKEKIGVIHGASNKFNCELFHKFYS